MVDVLVDPEMIGFKRVNPIYLIRDRDHQVQDDARKAFREVYGSDANRISFSRTIYICGEWRDDI